MLSICRSSSIQCFFDFFLSLVYPFHSRFVHEGDGICAVDLEEFTAQRKGRMEAAMDRSDGSFQGRAGWSIVSLSIHFHRKIFEESCLNLDRRSQANEADVHRPRRTSRLLNVSARCARRRAPAGAAGQGTGPLMQSGCHTGKDAETVQSWQLGDCFRRQR